MHNITFGSIVAEDREELTPHHFHQLVPLAQCALDYALFQANATGAVLVGETNKRSGLSPPLPSCLPHLHYPSWIYLQHTGTSHGQTTGSLL
jgi:hypothetical protein